MKAERFNEETNVVCVTVRNGRFLILVGAEEKNNAYQVETILSLQQNPVKPEVLDIVAVYDFIGYVSGPHHIPFEAIDAFHTLDPDFKLSLIRFANAKDIIDEGVKASQVVQDNLDELDSSSDEVNETSEDAPEESTEAKIIQFNRQV